MVGLPGAGKTVRARELAAERGALLMTPDAWMVSLFGQSQPDGKRDVLEGHLIALAIEALRLRLSVVLDFGLWGRDERSALRWMAASVGAAAEIIYLSVDRDLQLSRVQGRWERTSEQTFPMTEAVGALIDHAFRVLGVGRLVAGTGRDNARSIALLERLGMRTFENPDPGWPGVIGVLVNPHL